MYYKFIRNITHQSKALVFIFIIIALVGCKEDFYYESDKVISADQWSYQDSLDFTFTITDTTSLYNLYLDIEHSTEYPFQNIYLQVATRFPSGKRIKERLPIDFSDNTGRWYGKCNSEWCKLRVNLQQAAFFDAIGEHTITVEQDMRVNPLPGVRGMGMKLEDMGLRR